MSNDTDTILRQLSNDIDMILMSNDTDMILRPLSNDTDTETAVK